MKRSWLFSLLILVVLSSCVQKLTQMSQKQTAKVSPFEQVDFQELMRRYMDKDLTGNDGIEGIYSVSILVEKKSKGLFSASEKERVVERKENYATVAVLRDRNNSNREFMEISLDKDRLPSYPIRGEFTAMNESNIMIYNHFEPKGKNFTYTFTFDRSRDILEGVRTEVNGRAEFTYTLTYLKLYPKRIDSAQR